VAQGVRRPHRNDTLDDILAAPDRDALLDWLRHRPLALHEHGVLMVHAGVLPQWTARTTLALAGEVQAVLRGPDWPTSCRRCTATSPTTGDDSLQGADRLRVIVNALTRLRFCTPDGRMDFDTKDRRPDGAPPGYMPWFDVPGRRTARRPWRLRPLVHAGLAGSARRAVAGHRLRLGRLPERRAPGRRLEQCRHLALGLDVGRHARAGGARFFFPGRRVVGGFGGHFVGLVEERIGRCCGGRGAALGVPALGPLAPHAVARVAGFLALPAAAAIVDAPARLFFLERQVLPARPWS
jgi:diadenosine tetraphosphatase ApaH/serine/threonine PP2A family protein phosphatase